MAGGAEAKGPVSRKPADKPLKQQRLPAIQPIMSPCPVVACFMFVAIVFIPIGVTVIVLSEKVVEIEVSYNLCDQTYPTGPNAGLQKDLENSWDEAQWRYVCTSTVDFTIDEKMEAPVYMYYKLSNFYQNHRRYAKSRDDDQLAGEKVATEDLEYCDPFRKPSDHFDNALASPGQKYADGEANLPYSPCGLIAWSMFNDTIDLRYTTPQERDVAVCSAKRTLADGTEAYKGPVNANMCPNIANPSSPDYPCCFDDGSCCTAEDVAWSSDKSKKFAQPYGDGCAADGANCRSIQWNHNKPHLRYYAGEWIARDAAGTECVPFDDPNGNCEVRGHRLPDPEDEDFIVWMRTASLASFRKLYRRLPEQDLEPGKYQVVVDQQFPVNGFEGEKAMVLSTTTALGGKNMFLGVAYVVCGSLSFVLAVLFAVVELCHARKPSDPPFSTDNYRKT